jgi:gamma-glutamylputrescine oxidase
LPLYGEQKQVYKSLSFIIQNTRALPNSQSLSYQLSYWERESFFRGIDVAIIGSGIVGLSAALRVRELAPSARVVVLERGVLPVGASTRNAGFACFGSPTELLDDLDRQSEEEVWALVERRWKGLQKLRRRLGDERLRYEGLGGYELFRPEEDEVFEQCRDALPLFNQRVKEITGHTDAYQLADSRIESFGLRGLSHLIGNTLEGQLHPGEMMRAWIALAQDTGVEIYNGISVQSLEDHGEGVEMATDFGWSFTARRVIVATNGLARELLPDLPVSPARNQVLITAPIPGLRIQGAFHYDRGFYYFRNIDGRILLGGGRNLDLKGESTAEFGNNPLIRSALARLLHEIILPGEHAEIASWWSGILGLGEQKTPIVAAVSENVVAAVRLGGMGVAIGALVGEEGADLLLGHG